MMKYYELSMIHILCRFLSQWNWFISAATFFFFFPLPVIYEL